MIATAARCENSGSEPHKAHFVIVSHSLGSFMLLDTFAAGAGRIQAIDEHESALIPSIELAASHPSSTASEELCGRHDARPGSSRFTAYSATPGIENSERARRETIAENRGICFVLRNSTNLYFLANQFPLLEIARIQGLANPVLYGAAVAVPESRQGSAASAALANSADNGPKLDDALKAWADIQSDDTSSDVHKQIIAFSDPSDILTYPMPNINDVDVRNVTVHNATNWFGVFERPDTAHVGYFANATVLMTMFGQ